MKDMLPICLSLDLLYKLVLLPLLFTITIIPVFAEQMYSVDYLCADWGPAMELSAKPNELTQYSDTEEEVFFIKQLGLYDNSHNTKVAHGVNIYLCKMKSDGSRKTEIKELWHNVAYPIDVQVQATWMSVNVKERIITFTITFASSDITGLWIVNLDGSNLTRILVPSVIGNNLQTVDTPNWTPDGKWIVYCESVRGSKQSRIVKCNAHGTNRSLITTGPMDFQACMSPIGDKIVYVHDPLIRLSQDGSGERWVANTLWIVNLDGSNNFEITNPSATSTWAAKGITGSYPTWSPNGNKIYADSAGIVDVVTGMQIAYSAPVVQNWPTLNGKPANVIMARWGKSGLLCSGWGGGIQLSNEDMTKMWILASSDDKKTRW